MRLSNVIPFLIFMVIIVALYMSIVPSESNVKQLTELKLQLVNGKTLNLQELHGRPYIIRLFATWCSACKKDNAVLKELGRRMNAPIIGIAMQENIATLSPKEIASLPYDYIAIDFDGEVKTLLKNKAVPETIFVNEEGVITLRRLGAIKSKNEQ